MASYLQKAQQGQQQAQAPAPIAPVTSAPPQLSMPQPLTGPATHDDLGTTQPQANGSPVSDVANFTGNPLPGGGTVNASSHGTGSPFGVGFADPAAAAKIAEGLSGLVYSVPLGGYITADEANNPNSAYVKDYYGHPMTGGDGGANLKAAQIYRELGGLATTPNMTASAARLNAAQGNAPQQLPSFNERNTQGGGSGPWGGPWEFPGWHLGKNSVFAPTF